MKKAEEWDGKSQLSINKNERLYRLAIYKECQLDAMKEGMRRAAEIADKQNVYTVSQMTLGGERITTMKGDAADAILTAAEQLTEKDL